MRIIKKIIDGTIVKLGKNLSQATFYDHPTPNNVYKILYERAQIKSADYIEQKLNNSYIFLTKEELWDHCIKSLTVDGLICEFGVLTGYSINYIAGKLPITAPIYGFDSFFGIDDNWYGVAPTGAMNLNGVMPIVPKNVTLVAGYFDKTLPQFFLQKHNSQISLAHFDADTYAATKIALESIKSLLVKGSILIFDEYHGYPNWENGEFKAWKEFVGDNALEYEYLGFSLQQSAILIKNIPS